MNKIRTNNELREQLIVEDKIKELIIKDEEVWLDIPSYIGKYKISSFGRVKSIKRHRVIKDRILKLNTDSHGYYFFTPYNNGIKTHIMVHKIMGILFLGNSPDNTTTIVIDHIDENKRNNNIKNLQLVSHRENIAKSKIKNRIVKHNTTNVYRTRYNSWSATFYYLGNRISLGSFKTKDVAVNNVKIALDNIHIYNGNTKEFIKLLGISNYKSKYKNITYRELSKKWTAWLRFNGKVVQIGSFNDEESAKIILDKAKKIKHLYKNPKQFRKLL